MIGLNEQAWSDWLAHRKAIKKPYRTAYAIEKAQLKLASFGEWQQQVVDKSREREWTGLFPLSPREIAELQKARRATNKRDMMLAELTERARKCGYREPQPDEDLGTYACMIERREREVADERWRRSRSPVHIGALLEQKV